MSILVGNKDHELTVEELLVLVVKRLDTLIAILEHGIESGIELEIGDENDTSSTT